jgi:hypothetical protein
VLGRDGAAMWGRSCRAVAGRCGDGAARWKLGRGAAMCGTAGRDGAAMCGAGRGAMAGAAGRAIAGGAAGRAIAGGGAAARGIAAGGAAGRAGAAAGPGLPCPGWADAPTLPAMEPIPRNPTPRNNATKPMPRASMTALPRHTVAQPIQRASARIVSAGSMAALLPATIEPATNWPDGQISSVLRNSVKSFSKNIRLYRIVRSDVQLASARASRRGRNAIVT